MGSYSSAYTKLLLSILVTMACQIFREMTMSRIQYPDFGNYHCQYLRDPQEVIGPEDMTRISRNLLISTSNYLLELEAGPYPDFKLENIPKGSLFSINLQRKEVHEIKLIDYPVHTDFRPHGLYYNAASQRLSVINHAYVHGGERIDIFHISFNDSTFNVTAKYNASLLLPQYNGILNDLIQLPKGYLVSQYLPYADPLQGRSSESSKFHQMATFLAHKLGLRQTYVLWCTFSQPCVPLKTTASVMANGISWDQRSQVLINDFLAREVKVFAFDREAADPQKMLKYEKSIKLKFHPDNIEYDALRNKYYVAGIANVGDLDAYVKQFQEKGRRPTNLQDFANTAFVIEIDAETLEVKEVLVKSDSSVLFAASVAIVVDSNTLLLGSSKDISLQICEKLD